MPIPTYTTQIIGLNEQINLLAKSKPEVFAEIRKGIASSLKLVRSEIQPKTPVFSGRLKRNWRTEIKQVNGYWTGRFYNRHRFFLQVVAQGRTPGKPGPMYKKKEYPESFVNWVQAKMAPAADELQNTLYRVARSISRKGIRARPIVEEGGKASEARVIRAMMDAAARALEKMAYRGRG